MCLLRTGFIFIKHTIQNRPFASGLFCVLFPLYAAKRVSTKTVFNELIYNASYEYKRNRYTYSDYLQSIEDDIGKEFIRTHFANDFRYFKGYKDSGRRAVSPKSFKNYVYTRKSNNRAGNGEDAERGISAVKVDDNIAFSAVSQFI